MLENGRRTNWSPATPLLPFATAKLAVEANSIVIKNYCDGKTSPIYPLRKFDVKKSSKKNREGVRRFLVAMCGGAITPTYPTCTNWCVVRGCIKKRIFT
jgi:hypothetical protein